MKIVLFGRRYDIHVECPNCHNMAVAYYVSSKKDPNAPQFSRVLCPYCGYYTRFEAGYLEEQDIQSAAEVLGVIRRDDKEHQNERFIIDEEHEH